MSPMSDEQKREKWYSDAVRWLDLSERRTITTSSVSDIKPIPEVNSSPKSKNGSDGFRRRERAPTTRCENA
jgi:hypothetical protein